MLIISGKSLIIKALFFLFTCLSVVSYPKADDHSLMNKNFDLIEALKGVITNHKLIKATQIDIKASDFRLKQAKGGYYPSFDLTANYGHEHVNKYGSGNNTQLAARDATAKITQLITDFGLTDSNVKTSELGLKQTKAIEIQIKNDLLLRALTAYLRVIQSRESVKYAIQSVENIKRQTELEDAAVSAGGGLTSDVLQAKTQLAGAQARLIQFEGILSSAKHEFSYVFGFFPNDINTLSLTKPVFNLLPKTIEEAEKIALFNNPALKTALINKEIGKEAINTARASLFPTIKGTVSHSEKQDFGGIVGHKRESSAKIDLSYPLNLSFSEYAGKDAAIESYFATETRVDDQHDMTKQMIRTTWDGLETAEQNAQFLDNQAKISQEFLELARQERQAGNRSLLDVLGGETALINAQSDAIGAKIEVLINSYTLLSLMGKLSINIIQLI